MENFVAESAVVWEGTRIGRGNIVQEGARIGEGCTHGNYVVLTGWWRLGNNSRVADGTSRGTLPMRARLSTLRGTDEVSYLSVGDEVMIGANVVI